MIFIIKLGHFLGANNKLLRIFNAVKVAFPSAKKDHNDRTFLMI